MGSGNPPNGVVNLPRTLGKTYSAVLVGTVVTENLRSPGLPRMARATGQAVGGWSGSGPSHGLSCCLYPAHVPAVAYAPSLADTRPAALHSDRFVCWKEGLEHAFQVRVPSEISHRVFKKVAQWSP